MRFNFLDIAHQLVSSSLGERFRTEEIDSSLAQIASRWIHTMTEAEKQKVARTVGGNKYAKITRSLLDKVFEEILNDSRET